MIVTSLLLGTRLPSLPLVIRTRWTEVLAADAILRYNSEALAERGSDTSSGIFFRGFPRGVTTSEIEDDDITRVPRKEGLECA